MNAQSSCAGHFVESHLDTNYTGDYQSGIWKEKSIVCYVDGQPIYTLLRVVPQEIVAGIEEEISKQEKKEYQKQMIEMTLVD